MLTHMAAVGRAARAAGAARAARARGAGRGARAGGARTRRSTPPRPRRNSRPLPHTPYIVTERSARRHTYLRVEQPQPKRKTDGRMSTDSTHFRLFVSYIEAKCMQLVVIQIKL